MRVSTYQNDSYAGIVAAFNELRLRNDALPREYPASYAGIRDAILDIKKEWGNIGTGEYPPGWVPEFDSNGNIIGGDWVYFPEEGDLWFDERQGRLMVWINGDYYQTNGADQLTVISETQPNDAISGALWYQPSNQSLYLYTGDQWTLVTSATINTEQLALSSDAITDLSNAPAEFPDTTGVDTQKELNVWSIDTLEFLNTKIDNSGGASGATITVSDSAPTITADGELWYNSTTLQLHVSTLGSWETSTPDFSTQSEFTSLENDVSNLSASTSSQITSLDTRVTTLESATPTTYSLTTPSGLRLVDSNGVASDVSVVSTGGTTVTFGSNSISFDSSALATDISALQVDITSKADQTSLDALASSTSAADTTLQSNINVNTNDITALTSTVSSLPTTTDLDNYLLLAGGTMSGPLNMGGELINNVATPFLGTDAVNRQYVDDFKTFAANTYATLSGTSFASISITTSDTAVAGIDFSSSVTSSQQALKLASDSSNNVTFGNTDFANELAWDFSSTEDFCWKHGTTGKQLSVRSSGAYANELYITDFVVDGSGNETLVNTTNVKSELTKSAGLISAINTALNSNTDYAGFKTDLLAAIAIL